MTKNDLEITFKRCLTHYTPRYGITITIGEYIDDLWNKIVTYHSHRQVYTLDTICKSFDGFPPHIRVSLVDFDLCVVAACLQYMGPGEGGENGYVRHILSTYLKWPEFRVKQVITLCQIRMGVTMPNFAPATVMYDFNMMRLSFPREIFLENMAKAIREFPKSESHHTLVSQLTLLNFLTLRNQIYANSFIRDQGREVMALANINHYLTAYAGMNLVKVSEIQECPLAKQIGLDKIQVA